MVTAAELYEKNIEPVEYYWGDLLRRNGRLGIIGPPKAGKSYFTMQLVLQIATGTPFLGMETVKARGIYINFEISEEKLQERLRELVHTLGLDPPDNLLFETPGGFGIDTYEGAAKLEEMVQQAKEKMGGLDFIVIDPRRNSAVGA